MSPKEFLPDYLHSSSNEHLLEHIYFLEERISVLEIKVETLREVFTTMLELDEDEEEESDDEEDD